MNRKTVVAVSVMLAVLSAGSAMAEDQTYLAVRGGVFLPNGSSGDSIKGFSNFDTGYSVEIAAGYRPVPYAALEFGTGVYTTSLKESNLPQGYEIDRSAYGIPITFTVKGVQDFERLRLSAGAGVGLYQVFMNNRITSSSSKDESVHGMALGYQAVADVEFKLTERFSAGADFKWFSARPELEMLNRVPATNDFQTKKDTWEIGGIVVNLGFTFHF